MVVALSVLAMGEEALRDHQMEIVLGARHCDIEEPPLLLNLFRSAGAEVRWNTSIDDIQHEDRLPFLALGGMDGRKDQIILIEQRQAGLIAGRIRRIERQFCQETLPRRIPARDLFKLDQVGAPRHGVLMQPFELRFVPPTGAFEFSRPAAPTIAQVANHLGKCMPVVCRALRCRRIEQCSDRICRPHQVVEHSPRRCRSHAWDELHYAESRDTVAWVFDKAQQRQDVSNMRGVEKLQAAVFNEGNIPPYQLDFERSAVMRGAEEDRLLFNKDVVEATTNISGLSRTATRSIATSRPDIITSRQKASAGTSIRTRMLTLPPASSSTSR